MSDICGDMLQMGTAGRAHGINGEFFAGWHGETLPAENASIYLKKQGFAGRSYRVLGIRTHKGRLLLRLEGIDSRSAAEELNGAEIYMSRSSLPQPDEDEVWLQDLEGCAVLLESGQYLGVLDHFEFPANQEIWVIKADNGREILFPGQQCFIVSTDLQKRTIVISPPEGLLDIYNARTSRS